MRIFVTLAFERDNMAEVDYRKLMDLSPVGMAVVTRDMAVPFCNVIARQLAPALTQPQLDIETRTFLLTVLERKNTAVLWVHPTMNFQIEVLDVQTEKEVTCAIHPFEPHADLNAELLLKLQEQRFFYEFIIQNLPADLAIFDLDHRYVYINQHGIKDPELRAFMIGKDDFDYCRLKNKPTDMAEKRRAIFHEIMATKSFVRWEDVHFDPQGNRNIIHRTMGPLFDIDGNIKFIIGYGLNINDRRFAEESLLEANNRLSLLENFLRFSGDAIAVADKTGQLIYINRAAAKLFEISEEETHTKRLDDCIDIETDFQKWETLFHNLQESITNRIESKWKSPQGGDQYIDTNLRYEQINGLGYVIAISRDITGRKSVELQLRVKNEMQALMMDISSKYINLPVEEVQGAIVDSLRAVGEFVHADRAYIFRYDWERATGTNTHEWCREGIPSRKDTFQNIPFKAAPELIQNHQEGNAYQAEDMDNIGLGQLAQKIRSHGVQSFYTVPLMQDGNCLGFVGFDCIREKHSILPEESDLLQFYAQLIVNLYDKAAYIDEIEETKRAIEQMNQELEGMVEEKTLKNIELSKAITSQEKFVTIGEIASGIAHDLNTPIGAIKVGAENIRFTLESLFKETIWKCSAEQIGFACNRAMHKHVDLFIGGLQQRKEINILGEMLASKYQVSEEDIRKLAPLMVKSRMMPDDDEELQLILNAPNRNDFLQLIYLIQTTRTFVDTIITSSDKAAKVVQNMKQFLKGHGSPLMGPVKLSENILTVVNIFNYEIKRKASIEVNLHEHVEIQGVANRLYQLWSNILKNAVESFEAQQEKNVIRIVSEVTSSAAIVKIGNNGPPIPPELHDRIFEKFYTTKSNQDGTGLGLSIVKSIIDDHGAHLQLSSAEDWTEFIIQFKI